MLRRQCHGVLVQFVLLLGLVLISLLSVDGMCSDIVGSSDVITIEVDEEVEEQRHDAADDHSSSSGKHTKRSPYWNYFESIDKESACCLLCRGIYQTSDNTSNLG